MFRSIVNKVQAHFAKKAKERAEYEAFCAKWQRQIEREEEQKYLDRTGRLPTPKNLTPDMIDARRRYHQSEAFKRIVRRDAMREAQKRSVYVAPGTGEYYPASERDRIDNAILNHYLENN